MSYWWTLVCSATEHVLFTREGPTQASLFISNADGFGEQAQTQPGSLDYNPAWFPKGDWIVFTSERGGSADLYRIHPDATGLDRLDAYRASLAGKAAPVQHGLSGDQQFFLGFAQKWASKWSEAFLREVIMTDDHAPDQFRPATARNLDAWYAAFDVKPGDKLYLAPADRLHIW
jgi:hypothetical protein